jgi:peptidoglycan LD-endopeptidase LytH
VSGGMKTRLYKRYPISKYGKQRSSLLEKATRPGWRFIFFVVLFIITLLITTYELKLLHTRLLVLDLQNSPVEYEAFRDIQITENMIEKAKGRVTHLIKQHQELNNCVYIDEIGYLTFSMMARNYDPVKQGLVDEITFYRGIAEVGATSAYQELYEYYKAILSDLLYFPVPKVDTGEDVSYDNSWYSPRTYGGNRKHEGTDLMASNNIRGYFPIVSMTDGVIEKMGWLEQGGYRIGVRSNSGGYFYYAHLYTYAPDLKEGDPVIAGQVLGFMGDSGYGREGTIGQFDVHLHLGIYVASKNGEMSVNPYHILKLLETKRTRFKLVK